MVQGTLGLHLAVISLLDVVVKTQVTMYNCQKTKPDLITTFNENCTFVSHPEA